MILALDLGNSFIKVALFRHIEEPFLWDDSLLVMQRYQKQEFMACLSSLLENPLIKPHVHSWKELQAVIYSSVTPSLNVALEAFLERQAVFWHRVSLQSPHGFKELPPQLGSDLLCNLLAASFKAPQEGIVFDLGTALTGFAYRDQSFEGVLISAGMYTVRRALDQSTQGLSKASIKDFWRNTEGSNVNLKPGRTTQSALEAGILWGTFGTLKEWNSLLRKRLSPYAPVFITGGDALILSSLVQTKQLMEMPYTVWESQLTVKGLFVLACRLLR